MNHVSVLIPDQSPDIRASVRSKKMYLLNEALSRENQRQLDRRARQRRMSGESSSERRYRVRALRGR